MNQDLNITASILDRLVDMEPELSSESAQYRLVSERQILDNIFRDIENLLNTRCSPIELPDAFDQLAASLIRYGVRDFTVENPESSRVKQNLSREIEKAIALFEPRLKKPVVRLENTEGKTREVFFRISGTLVMEPLDEPISFDTFFDLNKGQYVIKK